MKDCYGKCDDCAWHEHPTSCNPQGMNNEMTDYEKGKNDALDYIEKRGIELLTSGKLTEDMAIGISVILGIAKAYKENKQ